MITFQDDSVVQNLSYSNSDLTVNLGGNTTDTINSEVDSGLRRKVKITFNADIVVTPLL